MSVSLVGFGKWAERGDSYSSCNCISAKRNPEPIARSELQTNRQVTPDEKRISPQLASSIVDFKRLQSICGDEMNPWQSVTEPCTAGLLCLLINALVVFNVKCVLHFTLSLYFLRCVCTRQRNQNSLKDLLFLS